MTRSLVALLIVALGLNLSSTGCKDAPPPNVTVQPAPPTPVTVNPHLNLPDGGLPTPIVNVAGSTIVIPSTVHCSATPNDCDGDTVLDDMTINGDQCPTVPRGNTPDPSRPGCPLTILPVDASPDVINDATDDAKPDGGMATEDVTPMTDTSPDVQTVVDAAQTPDAAMIPIPPPDAPVVPALPLPLPPVAALPVVPTTPPPVQTLTRFAMADIALEVRGQIPYDAEQLEAAQILCRIESDALQDAITAEAKAPCPAGTQIGCVRRELSAPLATCDQNERPYGCQHNGTPAWSNACARVEGVPNALVYQCVGNCTVQSVANALRPMLIARVRARRAQTQ